MAHRPPRDREGVRSEPRGVRGDPGSGPQAAHGPRCPPVLRPPDPAPLLRRRPDALVMFTNDHLLNWPINNIPEYAVGIGEEHVGPADWFDEWLGMEKYRVPGHPALARWIVNEGARRRLQFAWLRRMQFDDGI